MGKRGEIASDANFLLDPGPSRPVKRTPNRGLQCPQDVPDRGACGWEHGRPLRNLLTLWEFLTSRTSPPSNRSSDATAVKWDRWGAWVLAAVLLLGVPGRDARSCCADGQLMDSVPGKAPGMSQLAWDRS
jgi:hypothetical protein